MALEKTVVDMERKSIPIVRRGLDPEAVRARVQELRTQAEGAGARAEQYRSEVDRLSAENRELRVRLDGTQEQTASIGQVLILAQQTADSVLARSRIQADQLLQEARAQAQDIIADATVRAESLIQDASSQVQEFLRDQEGARSQMETVAAELEDTARRLRLSAETRRPEAVVLES